MKKIFITAIAGIICIITSCDNNSATTTDKGSAMREKNLAASDAISKAFQTGNEAAIDSFIADDFVDHSDRGDVKGKDSLKSMIRFIHANLKDMKTEKMHELADDDYVDASNINVQIQNDEVVLSGTVNSREEKRRAEDVVESISGVRNVENRIRVGRNDMNFDRYTGTANDAGGVGRESGTTNEIIRNEKNKK